MDVNTELEGHEQKIRSKFKKRDQLRREAKRNEIPANLASDEIIRRLARKRYELDNVTSAFALVVQKQDLEGGQCTAQQRTAQQRTAPQKGADSTTTPPAPAAAASPLDSLVGPVASLDTECKKTTTTTPTETGLKGRVGGHCSARQSFRKAWTILKNTCIVLLFTVAILVVTMTALYISGDPTSSSKAMMPPDTAAVAANATPASPQEASFAVPYDTQQPTVNMTFAPSPESHAITTPAVTEETLAEAWSPAQHVLPAHVMPNATDGADHHSVQLSTPSEETKSDSSSWHPFVAPVLQFLNVVAFLITAADWTVKLSGNRWRMAAVTVANAAAKQGEGLAATSTAAQLSSDDEEYEDAEEEAAPSAPHLQAVTVADAAAKQGEGLAATSATAQLLTDDEEYEDAEEEEEAAEEGVPLAKPVERSVQESLRSHRLLGSLDDDASTLLGSVSLPGTGIDPPLQDGGGSPEHKCRQA